MTRPSVYLAAPLFNPRERSYNLHLSASLEALSLDVFLPQRDGTLLVDMLAAGVPQAVAERRVFLQDTEAMRKATCVIAVLDGVAIDDGVAFELGYMFSLCKVCVGLQTDVRRALPSGNNPMIGQALSRCFASEGDLFDWAANWASEARILSAG